VSTTVLSSLQGVLAEKTGNAISVIATQEKLNGKQCIF
jgi:hypothetical protein